MSNVYTNEQISHLVEGTLDWETMFRMLSMPKDHSRFAQYLAALQTKVKFKDRIVLPLGPHLHIVQKAETKKWVTMCDCGHEFGDWRENWKLNAVVYVRDTEEAMVDVYPKLMAADTNWQVYREYYCPKCGAMHDVEAPTPWYPVIHDFEPDIDAFYRDWVNLPLPERA